MKDNKKYYYFDSLKIPKQEFDKWIEALRSGNFKQARKALQTKKGYCCLGVACEILIPENKKYRRNNILCGSFPYCQRYSPEWLQKINYSVSRYVGVSLDRLNDTKRLSFDEIADVLELLIIHEATN